MSDKLAGNLRYLRTTRKPEYSQREFALKLRVSRSTYSRYENGLYIPPLWFLREVATFYDINIDSLINDDLTRSETSEE